MAVSKKNIQETIPIPSSLSPAQKQELGNRIIEEVQSRTKRGISKTNSPFPKYSKDYHKSGTPDLTETGDMLIELDIIKISDDSITIGYDTGHADAGKVEGQTIGSYGQSSGNPSKARDFIGLPAKVINILVAEVKADGEDESRSAAEDTASRILGE